MKTTINLDDGLVREAMALHQGKTKTAVLELGLHPNPRLTPREAAAVACGE